MSVCACVSTNHIMSLAKCTTLKHDEAAKETLELHGNNGEPETFKSFDGNKQFILM